MQSPQEQPQKSRSGEQEGDLSEGGGGKQWGLQGGKQWGPRACPPSLGPGEKDWVSGRHSGQAEFSSSTQKKAFLTIRTEWRGTGCQMRSSVRLY